jgi:hypothetical protein
MKYLGEFTPAKTIRLRFNTHKADGTPITLAGTPAISVYKDSTTESAAGVTLAVDYDSRTGLHDVAIDTSADGTFYAAGKDFDVVITTGTVDSISVVGTVVGTFSLSNRAALRPATADRTLDVDGSGRVVAGTVADKTGYSLTQSFPTNFANLGVDASGRLDVGKWLGSAVSLDANNFPNVNARDWGGAVVSGSLPNTTTPPTVVQIRQEMDTNSTKLDVAVSSRLAAASYTAPDNTTLAHLATGLQSDGAGGYQFTTLALANAPSGGGGGTADWSATERNQIRFRLGIDGISGSPSAAPVLPVTVSDKTGFKLASDGLDSISTTAPAGVAANFREIMVQVWRRFLKPASRTPTQLKTFADNGTTVLTTQTISDDGAGNETQGAAT